MYTVTSRDRSQKREINLLRDTITAAKSSMGIVLDQYDAIHEDINEWFQPPKSEVDKTVKAEVDKVQPAPVEHSKILAISKGGLHIHFN